MTAEEDSKSACDCQPSLDPVEATAGFTLEHEERRYRVTLHHGTEAFAVSLTIFASGRITVTPAGLVEAPFNFLRSDPECVLAIGRLLIACARKAGACDG